MHGIIFEFEQSFRRNPPSEAPDNPSIIIRRILASHGFCHVLGHLHISYHDDPFVDITNVMIELRKLSWFRAGVKYIKALRIHDVSDFTTFMVDSDDPIAAPPTSGDNSC